MRSTDASLLEFLRRYLGEFAVQEGLPDDTCFQFSADCGADRVLAGGKVAHAVKTLYFSTLRVYRDRDPEEMAGRLISLVRTTAFDVQNEFLLLRAGAVSIDGTVVLMPSPPQPHLPALVAGLVAAGAGYLGDEEVRLDPVLRAVHGIPLPILLDYRDFALFPRLDRRPSRARRRVEDRQAMTPRRPVAAEELGGRRAEDARSAGWIVFPRFEPGAETRLEPLGGSQALFAFIEAGLNLHVWEERALIMMRELLDSAAVSRLTVGSLHEACDLLARSVPQSV